MEMRITALIVALGLLLAARKSGLLNSLLFFPHHI